MGGVGFAAGGGSGWAVLYTQQSCKSQCLGRDMESSADF